MRDVGLYGAGLYGGSPSVDMGMVAAFLQREGV